MNDLVKEEVTMTSLQIAEATGKRHDHVIRDIKNILQQLDNQSQPNFGVSEYKDSTGRRCTMYVLTPKGVLCLVSGYRADLRMKIIDRLEQLEKERNTNMVKLPNFNNPAEAARAWADEVEAKETEIKKRVEAEKEIKTNQPLVNLGTSILKYDDDISIREMAKILNQNGYETGSVRLTEQLKKDGYMNQDGLPSQKSVDLEIMAIVKFEKSHGNSKMIYRKTVITSIGQNYFINKYVKKYSRALRKSDLNKRD